MVSCWLGFENNSRRVPNRKAAWHRCAVVGLAANNRAAFDVDREMEQAAVGGRVGWEEADGEVVEGAPVVDLAFFTARTPIPAATTKTMAPTITTDDETPCFPTGAGALEAEAAGWEAGVVARLSKGDSGRVISCKHTGQATRLPN